ncbi:MAG: hypothetical protein U5K75_00160 [Ahrensia sp.]|nr:hypothetical protein [Ahrensia sp.]
MFLDRVDLPESYATPTKPWGQAWSELAVATDDLQDFVDNSNARQVSTREAYDRQIKTIHERTGVQLQNPYRQVERLAKNLDVVHQNPSSMLMDYVGKKLFGRDDVLNGPPKLKGLEQAQADYATQLGDLAVKFPDQAALFDPAIGADFAAVSREAQEKFDAANASPELGLFGQITATLAGGVTGSFKDPLQLALMAATLGTGTAASVAGRIGQVAIREAALNAGIEIPLQAINQNYRKDVGLDFGFGDAARNVAAAGVLGRCIWRCYTRRWRACAQNTWARWSWMRQRWRTQRRLLSGLCLALSSAAILKSWKRLPELQYLPNKSALLSVRLSKMCWMTQWCQQTLADGDPARMAVYEAAMRYADDPDNNLPPEMIEQMLADQAGDEFFDDMDAYVRSRPELIPDDPLDGLELAPVTVDNIGDTFDAPASNGARAIPQGQAINNSLNASVGDVDALINQELGVKAASDNLQGAISDFDPVGVKRRSQFAQIQFIDPDLDENGNYADLSQLVPVEDNAGNTRLVSQREAYELAGEDDYLADVLEACKL